MPDLFEVWSTGGRGLLLCDVTVSIEYPILDSFSTHRDVVSVMSLVRDI